MKPDETSDNYLVSLLDDAARADCHRTVIQARQMRADARLIAKSARATSDRARATIQRARDTMRRLEARRHTIG